LGEVSGTGCGRETIASNQGEEDEVDLGDSHQESSLTSPDETSPGSPEGARITSPA